MLVDSYVHGIIKKHNVTEEEIRAKQVKQKLNPELMTIHQKILGISSPMLNIVNRTSNYTAVPTIFCQKRRRQIDGFTPEGYSMDFCGTSASKVVLPPKATAEEVKVVSDYEELLPLNCFSRYEHNMASNIGWTRDHKRSHADFDVPQNRQYDEHVYTTATSVSCESSRSDEMFYMENHSTKDNLKIYPIANAPEGSFIELQPVKGCSQYDTSMTATYVIEDHYHLSDPHQYTLMLNDFAYCSTDYSRL